MSTFKFRIKDMVEQMNLILLDILTKLEREIMDEIMKNPNLSDDDIENLLLVMKSLSDEINSRISIIINKK